MTTYTHYLPPKPLSHSPGALPVEFRLMPRARSLIAELSEGSPDDLFTPPDMARMIECDPAWLRVAFKDGRRGPEQSGPKVMKRGYAKTTFTRRAVVAWLRFLDREHRARTKRQAKLEALRKEMAALNG
jgi:hypothetical protein